MHVFTFRMFGALTLAGALALTGCQGDSGAKGDPGERGEPGDTGEPGEPGQDGNDGMNGVGGELKLVIDGVATTITAGVTTAKLTFTVYPAAAVCPGSACNDNLSNLKQKVFYASEYDATTNTFPTARSFSFSGIHFKGLVDGGKGAQYTATRANAAFTVETSQSGMVYGYIGNSLVLPAKGHYQLLDDVSSASKVYGTIAYSSNANVSGCETCHVAPYSKHGYRQASVEGLPDMASCKACHTDQRVGTDQIFQMLVDDPVAVTQLTYEDGDPQYSAEQLARYAYRATVMNDTHQSHAMEFAYPQSMANCVSCHAGKLETILDNKFFKLETCKSCHAPKGPATEYVDAKRAPALATLMAPFASVHPTDIYAAADNCLNCHKAGGPGKTFAQIHNGYSKAIYATEGARFSEAVKMKIDTSTYDAVTRQLTVAFSVTGAAANAIVKPTVVMSLYGYDTKDFVVSGHGSQPKPTDVPAGDGKRNLEWVEASTSNSTRLAVTPAVAAAGNTTWTAVADLTTWADRIDAGSVKRVEIGILPVTGRDQTAAVSATNIEIAAGGTTQTFDLVAKAPVASPYGKDIVDTAKCNKCHEALATTFHHPAYGSAGVVGCRLCHAVPSGGSHLEMQSRSIDSYVHSLHSFQVMDIKDVDFADDVESMRYSHHIESTYPNFSILNCESCHNPGTYEVPDQFRSLPGVLSAAAAVTTADRNIGTVPSYVTGPGSRACGSCHRAEMINEDDAAGIASFNQHAATFGTLVANTTTAFDAVTANVMAQIGGPGTGLEIPAGTQVESCSICHPEAGAEHQAAFNRWADGL
jgi:OmcA/MtrC family decaheme c-type cytochrome